MSWKKKEEKDECVCKKESLYPLFHSHIFFLFFCLNYNFYIYLSLSLAHTQSFFLPHIPSLTLSLTHTQPLFCLFCLNLVEIARMLKKRRHDHEENEDKSVKDRILTENNHPVVSISVVGDGYQPNHRLPPLSNCDVLVKNI